MTVALSALAAPPSLRGELGRSSKLASTVRCVGLRVRGVADPGGMGAGQDRVRLTTIRLNCAARPLACIRVRRGPAK
jgi:hypothetical protein